MITVLLASFAAGIPWLVGNPHRRQSSPPTPAPIDVALAIDLTAAGLATGASVPRVLNALATAAAEPELAVTARALRLGAPWNNAWKHVPDRYRPLAHALAPAWCDGVGTQDLLAATADQLRANRSQLAREAAERLAVRLVLPVGLCQLPAFLLLGIIPVVLALL